jgi:hypothetical protein
MTYGIITRVSAPTTMYDAVHTALLARTGTNVDGLLLHIGRATPEGFEVIEVWQSRGHFDRYNQDLIAPLIAELAGADGPPPPSQDTEEFEVRGLVIPTGGLSI